ncbi:TrmH family RNA methyltransferase [Cellulophaga sp. RHA_52]|uniref:TrmH family RNA methyltransferase n=1 Tax=Cellulophaga TaxID=104264 RepID=UPI0009504BE1|nr:MULTISPECIES: RNA methyltransferase [Cellulophaga]APU09349.1 RNA methyltransferase [Cellulophaga lytica]TVZ08952.1 TrmH family RNA methyltransferase [Cellulophaga sp. RHA_52]
MVSKSQIKFIKNLQQKKYRTENKLFVVEGIKTVKELVNAKVKPYAIYTTSNAVLEDNAFKCELISETDLKKISALKTPNNILAVFYQPKTKEIIEDNWLVAVDDVRDPGNLGTIIRLCDWFGVANLFCSKQTVDCYNPKTIQATMGSLARVNIVYGDLEAFLKQTNLPVYGAFMDGKNVYKEDFTAQSGVLVMGNEANGVSKTIEELITKKISIPQFGNKTTESLNVATATAILLNEIRRG